MNTLEIVVPCFNEQDCILPLYKAIHSVLRQIDIDWAIIFVNDGSKDQTIDIIKNLSAQHPHEIKYITFSRNFGKEAAIYAGLLYSSAQYVALMDADMQHPPYLLSEMILALDNGYDCCGAKRITRDGEPVIKSILSKLFYKIINYATSMQLTPGGSDYRMLKRPVVEAIISMKEYERFTKGIFSYVGFDTKWIEYENVKRIAGHTKWSIKNLTRYAFNGYFAFATAPLRLAVYLGFFIDVIAFLLSIAFIIKMLSSDTPRTGYGTIVCLITFFGGTIILLLGVIGEYLARIFTETKKRPLYIVKDTNIKIKTEGKYKTNA